MQGGHKLVDARNWCLAEELPYTQELQSLHSSRSLSQGKRQWTSAQLHSMASSSSSREMTSKRKTSGALLYTLRVEDPSNQTAPPRAYEVICPLYIWNPLRESPPYHATSMIYDCQMPATTVRHPVDDMKGGTNVPDARMCTLYQVVHLHARSSPAAKGDEISIWLTKGVPLQEITWLSGALPFSSAACASQRPGKTIRLKSCDWTWLSSTCSLQEL